MVVWLFVVCWLFWLLISCSFACLCFSVGSVVVLSLLLFVCLFVVFTAILVPHKASELAPARGGAQPMLLLLVVVLVLLLLLLVCHCFVCLSLFVCWLVGWLFIVIVIVVVCWLLLLLLIVNC